MQITNNKSARLNNSEEQTVAIMHALGDKTRFKMFKIMQSGREMCVSEIAGALGISTPAVSQHFRIFELTGMVEKERYGQKVCYKLKNNHSFLNEIVSLS